MDLFYILLILLVATRAFGEIAERLGQPSLVGELIAGIGLGALAASSPEGLPSLAGLTQNEVFVSLTDLGMFFLMLFAGLEMQPHKMLRNSGGALAVAVGGMVLPLALGVALGQVFLPDSALKSAQSFFLGAALAITAVPATVRILMDLGQLDSPVGQSIISAAVIDDILSLFLLSILTGVLLTDEALTIETFLILFAKILLFFGFTALLGLYIFPWGGRFMRLLKTQEIEISAILIAGFLFSVAAELMGLHFIVGAFVAGLYFGRKTIDDASFGKIKHAVSAITFGFLAPIFFASIGMHLDISALQDEPIFVLTLVAAAFFGKIIGSGVAARLFGFSRLDAMNIGIGMSPRGAVELVLAGVALKAGLFANAVDGPVAHIFSAVVIMAVVTTVLSPIILKQTFEKRRSRPPKALSD